MTREEFIKSKIELETKVHELKLELKKRIEPINISLQSLKQTYLNELLLQHPHIKLGAQFLYGKEKVWINEVILDNYTYELKVKLNKVKKDGTNGNASSNSYGTSITNLKEIVWQHKKELKLSRT